MSVSRQKSFSTREVDSVPAQNSSVGFSFCSNLKVSVHDPQCAGYGATVESGEVNEASSSEPSKSSERQTHKGTRFHRERMREKGAAKHLKSWGPGVENSRLVALELRLSG